MSVNTINQNENVAKLKKDLVMEQRIIKIKKFLKNKSALLGLLLTASMTILSVLASIITSYDPNEMDVANRLKAPSLLHIFGTDNFGRDLCARILYGGRISIGVGAAVCIITLIFGMVIGLLSSYYKSLDNILMRICDGLKAIPNLLMAIALMAVLGPSVKNVIISLAIVHTPDIARITRSAALVVKEQTYIEAMRSLGAKPARIIWQHIAPNVLSPLIVQLSFIFAKAIVIEAALSFLGAGVPAPAPSWGNILSDGKEVIYNAWWMVFYPGVFMALSVLGLNLFGDGLRDVLDPMTN